MIPEEERDVKSNDYATVPRESVALLPPRPRLMGSLYYRTSRIYLVSPASHYPEKLLKSRMKPYPTMKSLIGTTGIDGEITTSGVSRRSSISWVHFAGATENFRDTTLYGHNGLKTPLACFGQSISPPFYISGYIFITRLASTSCEL